MNLDFLPADILVPIKRCGESLCEIRLRIGQPIKIKKQVEMFYLTENGYGQTKEKAIICSGNIIDKIILNVTERSIYAHNEKIKKGFLDAGKGVRIGLGGECVYDGQTLRTIKNISSLTIRFPHKIIGWADVIFNKIIFDNKVLSTLIVSPPMFGKTTMLKDIVRKANENNVGQLLIVDERGEFMGLSGENIDVIRYSDKAFAFECGIRSLAPNVIITDELYGVDDWKNVEYASLCGVSVVASCHAESIDDITNKPFFKKDIFKRYVFINCDESKNKCLYVFDKDFNII